MKRWGVVLLGVFVIGGAFAGLTGLPTDVVEPEWRGDPGTTLQAWTFDTAVNPAVPTINQNSYPGTPMAEVYGVDPEPVNPWDSYNTFWKDEDNGHQGVWRMYGDSFMLLYIPNNPVLNPSKTIQLQMTYYASGYTGADPELFIFSTPTADNLTVEQISKTQVDEHFYYHVLWEINIEPNPEEEWIKIQPRDCTIYLDEIVVDTICVPEPATMLLLGLGGLLMRRKSWTM